jgi:bifunctional DNase/RNase
MTTATAVGHVEMRIAKVVGLGAAEDEPVRQYVVLEEVAGGRHLAIAIGQPEAFTLAAHLGGIAWPRPMTYQFVARLSASPWRARPAGPDRSRDGGNLHRHRQGGRPARGAVVDARPSHALNLTALVQAPIFVGTEVLQEAEARCQGDSPTAARLRRALAAPPMTVEALSM